MNAEIWYKGEEWSPRKHGKIVPSVDKIIINIMSKHT
jgi:hypothetical protein